MSRNRRPIKWIQLTILLNLEGKPVTRVQYVPVRVIQTCGDQATMIQYIDPEKGDYSTRKIPNHELYDQPA